MKNVFLKLDSQKAFLIFSGGNYRAVVAFCRELKALNVNFFIIARTKSDLILKTRYRKNVSAIRSTNAIDIEDIESCLKKIRAEDGNSELVICPSSEFLNIFLLKNRDIFKRYNCSVPLVDLEKYELVSNKYSFSSLCKKNGLKVPSAFSECAGLEFPFVARPIKNINSKNKSLYPYLIYNKADLTMFKAQENEEDFFFQEYISGESYYLYYYFSREGKTFSYSQKNLLQQSGGKSIVMACSSSIYKEPIAKKAEEMLKGIGFQGLSMIEVKLRDGEFFFIEHNPRLWGPSQLIVDAGSNILKAFIYDNLQGGLAGFPDERIRGGAKYMWFSGILMDILSGNKLKWHINPDDFGVFAALRFFLHDVYFHPDTLLLFIYEIYRAVNDSRKNILKSRMQ